MDSSATAKDARESSAQARTKVFRSSLCLSKNSRMIGYSCEAQLTLGSMRHTCIRKVHEPSPIRADSSFLSRVDGSSREARSSSLARSSAVIGDALPRNKFGSFVTRGIGLRAFYGDPLHAV